MSIDKSDVIVFNGVRLFLTFLKQNLESTTPEHRGDVMHFIWYIVGGLIPLFGILFVIYGLIYTPVNTQDWIGVVTDDWKSEDELEKEMEKKKGSKISPFATWNAMSRLTDEGIVQTGYVERPIHGKIDRFLRGTHTCRFRMKRARSRREVQAEKREVGIERSRTRWSCALEKTPYRHRL